LVDAAAVFGVLGILLGLPALAYAGVAEIRLPTMGRKTDQIAAVVEGISVTVVGNSAAVTGIGAGPESDVRSHADMPDGQCHDSYQPLVTVRVPHATPDRSHLVTIQPLAQLAMT